MEKEREKMRYFQSEMSIKEKKLLFVGTAGTPLDHLWQGILKGEVSLYC
jgi:hypothetical protein